MRQDPGYVRGVRHLSSREFASDLLSVQPLDAAWVLPFEDYSPARAFPSYKGQRNFAGLFWCSTNSRLVGYESWLERDHLMCLDFAPDVVGIASQPFRLDFDLAGGRRRHVPASFVRLGTVPASSWMPVRIATSAGMTAMFFRPRNPPPPRGPSAGCSMIRRGSILQLMNEHTVPSETGGYLFKFRGKRPPRETARWVTGVGLAGAGAATAVIGTASNSSLSMPLGIAVTVLGAIVIFLYAVTKDKTKPASTPAHSGKNRIRNVSKVSEKESIASQLALIANLYSQGALTPAEFVAAKRRILGI